MGRRCGGHDQAGGKHGTAGALSPHPAAAAARSLRRSCCAVSPQRGKGAEIPAGLRHSPSAGVRLPGIPRRFFLFSHVRRETVFPKRNICFNQPRREAVSKDTASRLLSFRLFKGSLQTVRDCCSTGTAFRRASGETGPLPPVRDTASSPAPGRSSHRPRSG